MEKERAYIIRFQDSKWVRTAPDGTITKFPTLQAAVESAKILTTKHEDGADVIWFDREGNKQGHWCGWKYSKKKDNKMEKQRKTLAISSDSWHGRRYLKWRKEYGIYKKYNYRENLCHYIRIVLFWSFVDWFILPPKSNDKKIPPIYWLMGLVILAGFITACVVYPVTMAITVGAMILVSLIAAGIAVLVTRHKEKQLASPSNRQEDLTPKDPSFFKVVWEWLVSKKHKVCPYIEVEKN
jgi:hypothetical protein